MLVNGYQAGIFPYYGAVTLNPGSKAAWSDPYTKCTRPLFRESTVPLLSAKQPPIAELVANSDAWKKNCCKPTRAQRKATWVAIGAVALMLLSVLFAYFRV
jgi:hypothetical protein